MSTTRRAFLATGVSAGAAAPLLRTQPSWLEGLATSAGPTDAVLVVVQIRGGWDSLNVLAEVDHPSFVAARPNIALPKAKALQIAANAKHYWHPAAIGFKTLYDRGDLAVVENIGYPKPNLSHFSSEKKWYSADPTTEIVNTGWLAKYLKTGYTGGFQIPAINIESRLNGAFIGSRVPVFRRVTDFRFNLDTNFYAQADNLLQIGTMVANGKAARPGADPHMLHIATSTVEAVADSDLLQTSGASYAPKATYPNSPLAGYLQIAARYITAGLKTKIYLTSEGGFDTHANEVVQSAPETGAFATRLANVAGSVQAFLDDIKAHNQHQRVIVLLFSEFSRRLGENGSLGTDHGHGGLAFLAGDPVKGGRYGNSPDLSKATTPYNNYYIPFDTLSTDFRSLYAEIITSWFNVADHSTILGAKFPLLGAL